MTLEDLQEMSRRHNQEELLHRTGFAPVLPDGRELFVRTGAEPLELYTRSRALVVAVEELVALARGARPFTDILTRQRDVTATENREERSA